MVSESSTLGAIGSPAALSRLTKSDQPTRSTEDAAPAPIPTLTAQPVSTQTPVDASGNPPPDSVERVSKAVERINEMMQNNKQMITFAMDQDSGRMVIRVVDSKTDELIRQIPNEETLKFAQYVDGLVGLIFNHKA
ncbi:flagellar protein FlaG [Chromatium okenii]|jgi:flagellar protein FlaG|uniref:Flagellar biosynthesis protein FlaG n=1 Tax=Chromatium okenii TaxID=61644 RepID=A0A2S7XUB0_9GAMM|nr:flagellar protein FlaG [Chromatium okenii]MBV5308260.1 flagellar protein FlaG [Chromatium okenii]PQJ97327.1 flagellar biosynthesis protein FlaG [Chromatium okenii]